MESIFTLPYSELKAIEILQRLLPKKEYSVLIPTSRQQKGFDCAVLRSSSGKCLTFQIKGSRGYEREENSIRSKKKQLKYTLWFNNHFANYQSGRADIWLFFGTYSAYDQKTHRITSRSDTFQKSILFALTDADMVRLSKEVRYTKKGKLDQHLYICFDNDKQAWALQAFKADEDFTPYLLKNKLNELRKFLS